VLATAAAGCNALFVACCYWPVPAARTYRVWTPEELLW
jgi:hypothetical protein